MIAFVGYFAYREYERKRKEQQHQEEGEKERGGNDEDRYRQLKLRRRRYRRQRSRRRRPTYKNPRQSGPLLGDFITTPLNKVVSNLNCSSQGIDFTTTNYPCHQTMEHDNDNGNGDIHQRNNNNGKSNSKSNTQSSKINRIGALEQDSFRDEVRVEWIRAVFGNDFPKRQQTTTEASSPTTKSKTNNNSWKGIGLAGISSYVSYTVDLQIPQSSSFPSSPTKIIPTTTTGSSSQHNNKNQMNKPLTSPTNEDMRIVGHDGNEDKIPSLSPSSRQQQQMSLGMTLSRLSLGLYVRTVRPGSEAWCAGVEENSVLVGINDGEMNLLAEPSKSALERMWQYEGYCCSNSTNRNISTDINTTSDAKYHISETTDTTNNNGIDTNTSANVNSGRCSAMEKNTRMKIRDPVSMTFIRNGNLYKVLFLSDPPYGVGFGIDWGPCGKFCLIQRVRPDGIADNAGVRPSSIVAGIYTDACSNNSKNTIYHLDHSSVATALKESILSCSQQQQRMRNNTDIDEKTIQIQLCFPPSVARSGHWERQQDALEDNRTGTTSGKTNDRNIGNNRGSSSNSDTTIQRQQLPRPRVVAELDGVRVRIHPLLGGGSMIGSGRRGSGSVSGKSPPPSNARRRSSSNSGGIVVSPSSVFSKLAERVATGELLSIWNNYNHYHRDINNDGSGKSNDGSGSSKINDFSSSSVEHGRFYRPCPVFKNFSSSSSNAQSSSPSPSSSHSIMDCWDAQQAFIYIVRHHLAGFNEVETKIRASLDTNALAVLREILEHSQPNGNSSTDRIAVLSDVLSSFLLFWMGWLTANENKPLELTQYLLKFVNQTQTNNNYIIGTHKNAVGNNILSIPPSSSSLAHHMEFLAGALDNRDIKMSLRNLRQQRQEQYTSNIVGRRVEEDNKNINAILPSIQDGDQSLQLKGSKFIKTTRHSAASAPNKKKSTHSKPQSRRLFQIFRKKKLPTNKMTTSSNTAGNFITSATTSNHSNSTITIKQRTYPQEMTLPSGYKTSSSSSTSHDDEFSPPLRSISQSSASTSSKSSSTILRDLNNATPLKSKDSLFANTICFLEELEMVCFDIESSLLQSFSQKFARWALQPWTTNKETALAKVTNTMRKRLERCNREVASMPLLNPIDSSSEPLLSIDTNGCYILPSAHFPLLLTFNCSRSNKKERPDRPKSRSRSKDSSKVEMSNKMRTSTVFGEEKIYRTTVKLVEVKGSRDAESNKKLLPRGFTVHGSVAGSVAESHQSVGVDREFNQHGWDKANVMVFDSRSTWGPPRTLSLRLTEAKIKPNGKENIMSTDATRGHISRQQECGNCWINLTPYWEHIGDEREPRYRRKMATKANAGCITCKSRVVASDAFKDFDEHGDLSEVSSIETTEWIEIELRITTEILKTNSCVKRSLLYKHDDDVRQEMFAIEFIKSCDKILCSCGLDMKMLTFRSIAVSRQRGFIEWVQGSVPMSEICQPFAGSILAKKNDKNKIGTNKEVTITNSVGTKTGNLGNGNTNDEDDDNTILSSVAKAGMTNYESLSRLRVDNESFSKGGSSYIIPNNNNPIQDFLRSLAYDPDGAYKIQRDIMDTFVKSCAGYSVCTYILGVGDRHLDNLLLHQSGHFFHCDYSFILGNDPKKYLPMRITQDMINGMGGWKSDNFCRFLSLACAAFLTLRRPENVRHLLSLIRLLEGCGLPDLEKTQTIEAAIRGVRDRLKLDLSNEDAIVFMEKLIEDSCASKMWIAVDAIHSLAQRF